MIYDRIVLPERPAKARINAKDAGQHLAAHDFLLKRANIPIGWPWRWAVPARNPQTDQLLHWILRDLSNDAVEMEGNSLFSIASFGERRHDPEASFNPQPFRQITRVLRSQGYEDAARRMAIYEQWATPPGNWAHRVVQFIYGGGFGFGLWPRRAAISLLFYVGIGWLATIFAVNRDWLIETPQVAAASYRPNGQGKPEFAFMQAGVKEGPEHELICSEVTDRTFDALVYAADTVLPFIPLHQETKCELRPDLHFLRFSRAAYTVLGWVVTSLALLTFSGIVKRFDGGSG